MKTPTLAHRVEFWGFRLFALVLGALWLVLKRVL